VQPRRAGFLAGVFLITFAVLVFQIVQTRILSVIAWYYLAFFAISVAMLGMTAGAVWLYLRRDRITPDQLSTWLSDLSLLTAVAMPASMMVQFSLITRLVPTATAVFGVVLLMAVMTCSLRIRGDRRQPGVDAQPVSDLDRLRRRFARRRRLAARP
jgi:hypothetical protein